MTVAFPSPHPLVVVILDGWGISFEQKGNAILSAPTPAMDSYLRYYPSAAIQAAGIEVGLPWGEVGNSETGHRNIGAGQVVYQDLPRIDKTIQDGTFFKNAVFLNAIEHARQNNSALHMMGLVSPGGVHAHLNHLFALLKLCAKQNFRERVFIHMFTDGRDTSPQSALAYLQSLEEAIGKHGVGVVASVTGRFYAMDRNRNWERTEATYNMLTGGPRPSGAPSARQAIEQSYEQQIFDEMIRPTAITRGGEAVGSVQENDALIFFNYRPDRARQITQAFAYPTEVGYAPHVAFQNLYVAGMIQYDTAFPIQAAFIDERPDWPLARVLSEAGLKQFHIAETEKYAHVTYYLNVGYEQPFPNEKHVMIPSSAVANFAEEPHMQAGAITDRVIEEIQTGQQDVYFINFANADMVAHTGDFDATATACAFVDQCIGRIEQAATAAGGALLVTADHGNAEEMIHHETGQSEKDHSSNPVPLHYVVPSLRRTAKSDAEIAAIAGSPIGVLADIAPTILDILHVPPPANMTGVSLLGSLR